MPPHSSADAPELLQPYRCRDCGKLLFKVDVARAVVQTVCSERRCRRFQQVNLIPDVAPRLRRPVAAQVLSPDELVALMESRWETWVKDKARRRAEVAVGLRFQVFQRDGFACRYCGRSASDGAILHADHVIPRSKGGPTTLGNLVTACLECNIGKSDRDIGNALVLE